ncbi:MAG: DUF3536 domain-containing protein [Candidatus Nitrospinota bacterium M3_3B_026]
MKKYLCVHGHFYQPPRENPWLEIIEVQDTAAPYHDWNERVNRECYAPNTASRLYGKGGRIKRIVNNFERISFNVGPTLMSWLEENDKTAYARIVEADKASAKAHGGHGSGLAQAYNHMIMPLATDRDKTTQVKWGIADFKRHFGRDPEGMWLPETAADKKTLQALAENGITFTILAPSQAKAVREKEGGKMTPVNGGIDPTRPYKVKLDAGREITVFFYDGPISQAVAFEEILDSGEKFAKRLKDGFAEQRKWSQIVNIATDGETYGHHHRFGEMALSYALEWIEKSDEIELTNYAEYLSKHPPPAEAEIHENSSWSCSHGVERWRSDCGCSIGGQDWNQKWRAPLREALDNLKTRIDEIYEREGGKIFKDPWEARDGYIEVILDRSEKRANRFLAERAGRELSREERVRALCLLEAQRNSMLMFTSCGWFFDDVSGIETSQLLKYAARAMQLVEDMTGESMESGFLEILKKAKSNIPAQGNGEDIYRRYVLPEKATLSRLLANHAISHTLDANGESGLGKVFEVREKSGEKEEYGDTALYVSRAVARSKITLEEKAMVAATLRLGGADITCFTRPDTGIEDYEPLVKDVFWVWRQRSMAELIRRLDAAFKDGHFTLRDLFMEQRRKAVNVLFADHIMRFVDTYDQLFWRNRRMMDFFVEAKVPPPREFKMAAQYILEKELLDSAGELAKPDAPERMANLLGEMRKWDVDVDLRPVRKELERRLLETIDRLDRERDVDMARNVIQMILAAQTADLGLDLWAIQNRFDSIYKARMETPEDPFYGHPELGKLGILLNFSFGSAARKAPETT